MGATYGVNNKPATTATNSGPTSLPNSAPPQPPTSVPRNVKDALNILNNSNAASKTNGDVDSTNNRKFSTEKIAASTAAMQPSPPTSEGGSIDPTAAPAPASVKPAAKKSKTTGWLCWICQPS